MTETHAVRPGAAAPRVYHFPSFTRSTLPNGVQIISAPMPRLPLVSIVVQFDAGASTDPVGREGLAALVAKALLDGTEAQDGSRLTEAFEQLGASVSVTTGWDSAAIWLTVLAANVEAAMQLLAEVVRTPGFRERDVMRLKAEHQAERLQIQTEPRALADEAFERQLYRPGSRYAIPEAGNTASAGTVSAAEIRTFYQSTYTPDRTTIIIAGDRARDQSLSLVERAFGNWRGSGKPTAPLDDGMRAGGRRIQIVAKPQAPQTELRIGHRGVPRGHRDYFKLTILNAALGGVFSSRINLNLREQHAYTYGAHSRFDWRRQHGPFVVSTAVESAVTADATREVVEEIRRIQAAPITESELSLVTNYMAGVFPIRFETTAAVANALATLATYELPDDYFNTYRQRISTVSASDVLDMAQQHLHPEALLILAVGDPESIRTPLQALQLGDVLTELDADELA